MQRGKLGILDAELEQRQPHHLAARGLELQAVLRDDARDRPRTTSRSCVSCRRRSLARTAPGGRLRSRTPRASFRDEAAVVENRVVEIEQKRATGCHLNRKWHSARLTVDGDHASDVLCPDQRRLVDARNGAAQLCLAEAALDRRKRIAAGGAHSCLPAQSREPMRS